MRLQSTFFACSKIDSASTVLPETLVTITSDFLSTVFGKTYPLQPKHVI